MGHIETNLAPVIEQPAVMATEIRGANLKDNFCNYTYELKNGPTAGDSVKRSGASIIHNDLRIAFSKLKPHLAVICEEIDNVKIKDIADLENLAAEKEALDADQFNIEDYADQVKAFDKKLNGVEKKVMLFFVTSYSLDGSGENASVKLIGFKRLSTGDDIELKTYKVKWDGAYPFIDELRAVIDDITVEVDEYMNGKAAPKLVQAEMEFDQEVTTEETE